MWPCAQTRPTSRPRWAPSFHPSLGSTARDGPQDSANGPLYHVRMAPVQMRRPREHPAKTAHAPCFARLVAARTTRPRGQSDAGTVPRRSRPASTVSTRPWPALDASSSAEPLDREEDRCAYQRAHRRVRTERPRRPPEMDRALQARPSDAIAMAVRMDRAWMPCSWLEGRACFAPSRRALLAGHLTARHDGPP